VDDVAAAVEPLADGEDAALLFARPHPSGGGPGRVRLHEEPDHPVEVAGLRDRADQRLHPAGEDRRGRGLELEVALEPVEPRVGHRPRIEPLERARPEAEHDLE
jgi:hypothetical protein